jgi:hypothetical protein
MMVTYRCARWQNAKATLHLVMELELIDVLDLNLNRYRVKQALVCSIVLVSSVLRGFENYQGVRSTEE